MSSASSVQRSSSVGPVHTGGGSYTTGGPASLDLSPSEDAVTCPLCMEDLDETDRHFFPCPCDYQVCLWCLDYLVKNMQGKCPACRQQYDDTKYRYVQTKTTDVLKRTGRSSRQAGGTGSSKRGEQSQKSQQDSDTRVSKSTALSGSTASSTPLPSNFKNIRVIQRNLAYVLGLPPSIARPEDLKKLEFFGRYGPISNIVVTRNQHGTSAPPCYSAYVTFSSEADAVDAIRDVDGVSYEGRSLRASFGTTKYCAFFLRGLKCSKINCFYLHHFGSEEDSFTREEMVASRTHFVGLRPPPLDPTQQTSEHLPLTLYRLQQKSKPKGSLFGTPVSAALLQQFRQAQTTVSSGKSEASSASKPDLDGDTRQKETRRPARGVGVWKPKALGSKDATVEKATEGTLSVTATSHWRVLQDDRTEVLDKGENEKHPAEEFPDTLSEKHAAQEQRQNPSSADVVITSQPEPVAPAILHHKGAYEEETNAPKSESCFKEPEPEPSIGEPAESMQIPELSNTSSDMNTCSSMTVQNEMVACSNQESHQHEPLDSLSGIDLRANQKERSLWQPSFGQSWEVLQREISGPAACPSNMPPPVVLPPRDFHGTLQPSSVYNDVWQQTESSPMPFMSSNNMTGQPSHPSHSSVYREATCSAPNHPSTDATRFLTWKDTAALMDQEDEFEVPEVTSLFSGSRSSMLQQICANTELRQHQQPDFSIHSTLTSQNIPLSAQQAAQASWPKLDARIVEELRLRTIALEQQLQKQIDQRLREYCFAGDFAAASQLERERKTLVSSILRKRLMESLSNFVAKGHASELPPSFTHAQPSRQHVPHTPAVTPIFPRNPYVDFNGSEPYQSYGGSNHFSDTALRANHRQQPCWEEQHESRAGGITVQNTLFPYSDSQDFYSTSQDNDRQDDAGLKLLRSVLPNANITLQPVQVPQQRPKGWPLTHI